MLNVIEYTISENEIDSHFQKDITMLVAWFLIYNVSLITTEM